MHKPKPLVADHEVGGKGIIMETTQDVLSRTQDLAAPIGRVLIASIFVLAGLDKISGYEGTQGYMDSMGVPGGLLPLVIAFEVGAGLAIVVGWQTRMVAFALAGFCVLSGIIFHFDPANQMQMIMLMKNIALAGGFLFLVANGPGAYALDNRRRAKAGTAAALDARGQ
jgi:putative oxidoreductase